MDRRIGYQIGLLFHTTTVVESLHNIRGYRYKDVTIEKAMVEIIREKSHLAIRHLLPVLHAQIFGEQETTGQVHNRSRYGLVSQIV